MKPCQASILVGLLWCLAILSVIVVGVLHTSRMDLLVVKNYGDRVQAHYLALAGIERATALLYRDAQERRSSQQNHSGNYYNNESAFRNVPLGRGTISVIRRGGAEEGGGLVFGVSDEESRLNANTASADALGKLDGMTPDVATAIVNWRGSDRSAGAGEAEYYAGLQPPRQPRNGPLQTVRELLMVRGVMPEMLLGKDIHQNGRLNADDESAANVDAADLGWANRLTVDSTDQNVSATGADRVNLQSADENTLTTIDGITTPIAQAIVAYRRPHPFKTVVDLLDVTNRSGARVMDETLFTDVADKVTVAAGANQSGLINVNTASLEVLYCLPGMTRELAQAIISQRQSAGFFNSFGDLLKVPDLTRDALKQIAPLITTRSETYRILGEGRIPSTGARQRIQAIIHVGLNDCNLLSWREDDL